MKPKVSICIPAYKNPKYLKKTLDSILIQKYEDWEVIITDDSPDDSIKTLCQKFDFGNRLKYHKNQERLGSPENWNEAIRRASGKYIKIMHHDDWFSDPKSLKKYVLMLDQNPHADLAFSSSRNFHSKDDVDDYIPLKKDIELIQKKPNELFFGNIIGSPSATIWRKSISLYFDKKLIWLVDIDFYIRLLKKNPEITFCKNSLININADETRISGFCLKDKNINLFEHLYLFDKIHQSKFLMRRKEFIYFLKLFIKYDVNSIQEIRNSGYIGKINKIFYLILFLKKIHKKTILKEKQPQLP